MHSKKSNHFEKCPEHSVFHNKGLPSRKTTLSEPCLAKGKENLKNETSSSFLDNLMGWVGQGKKTERKEGRGGGGRGKRGREGGRKTGRDAKKLLKFTVQGLRFTKNLRLNHRITGHFPSPIPYYHINRAVV